MQYLSQYDFLKPYYAALLINLIYNFGSYMQPYLLFTYYFVKRPNLLLAVCTNRNPPQAPSAPSFVRLHHENNHSSRADYPPSESSGAASEVEESHLRVAAAVVLGGQTRP